MSYSINQSVLFQAARHNSIAFFHDESRR